MTNFRKSHLLFFFIFFLNATALPQTRIDADSLLQRAVRLSIIHQYTKADSLLDLFIQKNPNHPAGYFFKAACLQSKMMDYEKYDETKKFVTLLQKTIRKADAALNSSSQEEKTEMMFFKAGALSYLAFQQGKEKHYFRAIEQGIRAVQLLNKIIKIDSNFYDAYLGIGTFKFWRSQLTKFINWLPMVDDERASGLKMVEIAIEKSNYSRYAAMNGIVWMLLEVDRPREALKWAEIGLRKFPGSRFFLWGAAKSAFADENFSLAKNYFEQILHSMAQDSIHSSYNIYICHLNLAKCDLKINNFAEAEKELIFLKDMKLDKATKKRLQKHIRETKNLEKQLAPLLNIHSPKANKYQN